VKNNLPVTQVEVDYKALFYHILAVWLSCLAFGGILFFASGAGAESLGLYGNTWEIGERDFLDVMRERVVEFEKSGKFAELKKKAESKVRDRILNPAPIDGIKTAMTGTERTYYYDPSFVVEKTITDHQGNIVVPAGRVVSPLHFISLSKPLLFIDARDNRQVNYAHEFITKEPRTKVILVAGSWVELTKKWRTQIYYDQAARIVHKFGIEQVPAVVRQQGELLKIDEIAL
jgi:conjugal transfer pilus assembly protein TraW